MSEASCLAAVLKSSADERGAQRTLSESEQNPKALSQIAPVQYNLCAFGNILISALAVANAPRRAG